jgi:hypothetical protein
MKKREITVWCALAAVLVAGGSTMASGSSGGGSGTVLVSTAPQRVLDTREAGAAFSTLGPDGVGRLSFTGIVPADARAVELNITITNGTQPSFITVWPSGTTRSTTSVINWTDAQPDANALSVKLGTNQSIDLFNRFGSVDVVIDLMGYFLDGVPGPTGPTGPPGVSGVEVESNSTAVTLGVPFDLVAACPAGKSVISGGFAVSADVSALEGALQSAPVGSTGWRLAGESAINQSVSVYAVCANVAG